jgi:hypothetical protein
VTPEALARTIQLTLAPVVMISACAIFVGGLLAHYTNLSDRIRAMTAERRDVLRRRPLAMTGADADVLSAERLEEIDAELPELDHRHRLVHHSVVALYLAILVLVASMCLIAVASVAPVDWLVAVVLALVASGVLAALVGVALVAVEVRISRRTLEFEVRRVLGLDRGAAGTGPNPLPTAAARRRLAADTAPERP